MKCTGCKFYQKSKMFGNHCICTGTKPCVVQHHNKIRDYRNGNKLNEIPKECKGLWDLINEE